MILSNGLDQLKAKKDAHPELYQIPNGVTTKSKSLLDALYEEGIIPTYSFPKNVVSTYISDNKGHTQYQVERGLDVAIGEYAPGLTKLVVFIIPEVSAEKTPEQDQQELSLTMKTTKSAW